MTGRSSALEASNGSGLPRTDNFAQNSGSPNASECIRTQRASSSAQSAPSVTNIACKVRVISLKNHQHSGSSALRTSQFATTQNHHQAKEVTMPPTSQPGVDHLPPSQTELGKVDNAARIYTVQYDTPANIADASTTSLGNLSGTTARNCAPGQPSNSNLCVLPMDQATKLSTVHVTPNDQLITRTGGQMVNQFPNSCGASRRLSPIESFFGRSRSLRVSNCSSPNNSVSTLPYSYSHNITMPSLFSNAALSADNSSRRFPLQGPSRGPSRSHTPNKLPSLLYNCSSNESVQTSTVGHDSGVCNKSVQNSSMMNSINSKTTLMPEVPYSSNFVTQCGGTAGEQQCCSASATTEQKVFASSVSNGSTMSRLSPVYASNQLYQQTSNPNSALSNLAVGYFMPPAATNVSTLPRKGIHCNPAGSHLPSATNTGSSHQSNIPFRSSTMHLDILSSPLGPNSCSHSPLNILSPCSSNASSISFTQANFCSKSQDVDPLFSTTADTSIKDVSNQQLDHEKLLSFTCVDDQQFLTNHQSPFGNFIHEQPELLFGNQAIQNLIVTSANSNLNFPSLSVGNICDQNSSSCHQRSPEIISAIATENFTSDTDTTGASLQRALDSFSTNNNPQDGGINITEFNFAPMQEELAVPSSNHNADITLLLSQAQSGFSPALSIGSDLNSCHAYGNHSVTAGHRDPSESSSAFIKPTVDASWLKLPFLSNQIPTSQQNSSQPSPSLIGDSVCTSESGPMNTVAPGSANSLSLYARTNSLSPHFLGSLMDISPGGSSFASPRNSAKSSYHSGGMHSRNKRTFSSISPLSADGIDLQYIIRSSPTSLLAYLSGSRSSSASMSPAPGEGRKGSYGHLRPGNSSSSPHSGSASSGRRQSVACTPQQPIVGSSFSAYPRNDSSTIQTKDHGILDSEVPPNLITCQQMQALEEGLRLLPEEQDFANHIVVAQNNVLIMEQQNNIILKKSGLLDGPQMSSIQCGNVVDSLEPNETMFTPTTLPPPVPNHPPPSYDQHMARKMTFQKKNSSDSSQPSNYSSFDSSEGDRLTGEGGDSDQGGKSLQNYICRWVDCNMPFMEQDDLVQHIVKKHIDQRKGEEFVCFWEQCGRRFKPFNARYKLLMHMRVHSGERPNKCTYPGCKKSFSRLENLKIHIRSHTGERPYPCQHVGCTKIFSNSSDRAKHQRTHIDRKPYACQIPGCTKRYTDPSSLRKHVKNHGVKNDNTKKKIPGGMSDQEALNECLTIQPIRPSSHCTGSPPEPLQDSGLGRSPRASRAEIYTDNDPSVCSHSSNQSSRSATATCMSNHPSPSSQQGSPCSLASTSERKLQSGALSTTCSYRQSPMFPPISHTSSLSSSFTSVSKSTNGNAINLNSSCPSFPPLLKQSQSHLGSSLRNSTSSANMTLTSRLPNASLSSQRSTTNPSLLAKSNTDDMKSSMNGGKQMSSLSSSSARGRNVFPSFEEEFSSLRFAFESSDYSGGVS